MNRAAFASRTLPLFTGLLILAACFIGCARDDSSDTPGTDDTVKAVDDVIDPNTDKSWTILIYMAADNDLEPFAIRDLHEMAEAGSSKSVVIAAQVDRSADFKPFGIPGLGDWVGASRIVQVDGRWHRVADLGDTDMSSGAEFEDFITWGLKNFPAERTALLLWDHGFGWKGFAVDSASSTPMRTRNCASGRPAGGCSTTRHGVRVCPSAT